MKGNVLLDLYAPPSSVWDEMFDSGKVRDHYDRFAARLQDLPLDEMFRKDELARKLFMKHGRTFTIYSGGEGIEKVFPRVPMRCGI